MKEKFHGIHFHWRLCLLFYIFPEFSRFFKNKKENSPDGFPEILTIFHILWVSHVFQVCSHPECYYNKKNLQFSNFSCSWSPMDGLQNSKISPNRAMNVKFCRFNPWKVKIQTQNILNLLSKKKTIKHRNISQNKNCTVCFEYWKWYSVLRKGKTLRDFHFQIFWIFNKDFKTHIHKLSYFLPFEGKLIISTSGISKIKSFLKLFFKSNVLLLVTTWKVLIYL